MRERADLVAASIVLLALAWIGWHWPRELGEVVVGDRTTLYGPLAGVFASLLGFVLTALTVLTSVLPTEKFHALRETGHDTKIVREFAIGTAWCGLGTVLCVVALVIDRANGPTPQLPYLFAVLGGASGGTAVAIFKCVQLVAGAYALNKARSDSPSTTTGERAA